MRCIDRRRQKRVREARAKIDAIREAVLGDDSPGRCFGMLMQMPGVRRVSSDAGLTSYCRVVFSDGHRIVGGGPGSWELDAIHAATNYAANYARRLARPSSPHPTFHPTSLSTYGVTTIGPPT